MRLIDSHDEQGAGQQVGPSNLKTKEKRFRGLRRLLGKKGDQARQIDEGASPPTRGTLNAQDNRARDGDVNTAPGNQLSATSRDSLMRESLWDRAYAALRKDKAMLMEKYEELLLKEVQMAESTSITYHLQATHDGHLQAQRKLPKPLSRRHRRTTYRLAPTDNSAKLN